MAPSPKKHAVTRSRRCIASASARPTAIGRPPPTIALPPKKRVAVSKRCIEPPRPRLVPRSFPYISARIDSADTPRASAWPCSR
jgi:hypothetical protein